MSQKRIILRGDSRVRILPISPKRWRAVVACGLATLGVNCAAKGQVWTWLGEGSAYWTAGGNWTYGGDDEDYPGQTPNSFDVAIIPANTSGLILNANVGIKSMTLAEPLSIQQDSQLGVSATVTLNDGQINIGSNSELSTPTITGTGTVTLADATFLGPNISGVTTTSGIVIVGYGEISNNGNGIINGGIIDASTPGETLGILTSTLTNSGTLEQTGGALYINSLYGAPQEAVTISNTGGTIIASGSNMNLGSYTINGGLILASSASIQLSGTNLSSATLSTASDGLVYLPSNSGSVSLQNVTSNGSLLDQSSAGLLTVLGTLTDNGSIQIGQGNNSGTTISFSSATLAGSGTLTLDNLGASGELAGTFTQSSSHTIDGHGQIGAIFTNQGIVNADVSSTTLEVASTTLTNTGTLEATAGTLLLDGGATITNTGGVLLAAGANVELLGENITGGTLESSSGGQIFLPPGSGSVTLQNVTNSGSLVTQGGADLLTINGTITDNGSIQIGTGNNSNTTINFSNATLTGSGTLTLDNLGASGELMGTLTQSSTHTINGHGQITATLTNSGLVNASLSNTTLDIFSSTVTNTGTMEATAGTLSFDGGSTITNTGGLILASGANVTLNNTTITGGTLNSSSGGAFILPDGGSGATLQNITNNGSLLMQRSAGTLLVTGTLTDNGTIQVGSGDNSGVTLSFSNATLTGTGTVTLDDGFNSARLIGSVTQSAGHTIDGYGEIDAALTNNGTINADASANTLNLTESTLTNGGTLEQSTGRLSLTSGVSINNAGGTIFANGSNLGLSGATITSGTLNSSSASIVFSGAAASLAGVTNQGSLLIQGGTNVSTTGTTTNNGTININYNNSSTSTLDVGGPLAGSGTLIIGQGAQAVMAPGIGGSAQGSLSITGNGSLDLSNNHLLLDYGSGPDPISSIVGYIESGYNSGAWNGPGINSSMAATNNASSGALKYGIGYADAADPGDPAGLASGEIEVKYTLLGDANLDSKVNGADFLLMAANFNHAVTNGWDEGDFDYSGTVNGADFVLLADNFNQYASESAVSGADLDALDSFAAANGISLTSVPEPASGALLLIASAGVLTRRSRTRKTTTVR